MLELQARKRAIAGAIMSVGDQGGDFLLNLSASELENLFAPLSHDYRTVEPAELSLSEHFRDRFQSITADTGSLH